MRCLRRQLRRVQIWETLPSERPPSRRQFQPAVRRSDQSVSFASPTYGQLHRMCDAEVAERLSEAVQGHRSAMRMREEHGRMRMVVAELLRSLNDLRSGGAEVGRLSYETVIIFCAQGGFTNTIRGLVQEMHAKEIERRAVVYASWLRSIA
eukprot:Hpha_TRINITY_DN37265_c0_g1::TRINITY_DN37265_c0_g1_i1::g.85212::m.85212